MLSYLKYLKELLRHSLNDLAGWRKRRSDRKNHKLREMRKSESVNDKKKRERETKRKKKKKIDNKLKLNLYFERL